MIKLVLHAYPLSILILQLKLAKLVRLDAMYALVHQLVINAKLVMQNPHQVHAVLADLIVLNATTKRQQNAANVM